MSKKKILTVWLPVEMIRDVKLQAVNRGVRYSLVVEEALRNYFKNLRKEEIKNEEKSKV